MRPVVIRILHACGMIDVHEQIRFHPEAVEKGLRALRAGAPVLCDSRMVANGIIARHLPADNPVRCWVAEESVIERARIEGTTSSMAAVDCWSGDLGGSVVAIGNAPTALFRLLELLEEGARPPAVILGFPVGFVGAAESKQELEQVCSSSVPFITVHGRLGGSAMAAAAINAIAMGANR